MGQASSDSAAKQEPESQPKKPLGKLAAKRAAEAEARKQKLAEQKRLHDEVKTSVVEARQLQRELKERKTNDLRQQHAKQHADPMADAPRPARKQPIETKVAPAPAPARRAVKQDAKQGNDDEDDLPPEVAAALVPVDFDDEGIDESAAVLAAIEAATMLCCTELSDEDELTHTAEVTRAPLQQRKKQQASTTAVPLVPNDADEIADEDVDAMPVTQDMLDELNALEAEVTTEERQNLELQIASLRREALALGKAGDKPKALDALRQAKALQQQLDAMSS